MEPGWRYPPIYAWNARKRAEAARIEARFLAGRARLAFGPPGSWPRSPQLRMVMLAPVTVRGTCCGGGIFCGCGSGCQCRCSDCRCR